MTDFRKYLEVNEQNQVCMDEAEFEGYFDDFYETLYEFMDSLDYDSLSEDQKDLYEDVLEMSLDDFDDFEGEMTDEQIQEVTAKKKKIKRSDRIKRKREYKKNKAKIKRTQKKRRKTAAFKQYKKKSKRLGKMGKTATGKRKTKFI